jgi:hypothetical protein
MMTTEEKKKIIYDKFGGHCAYCGEKLTMDSMRVDMVMGVTGYEDNRIENLFPVCVTCRIIKGGRSLVWFRGYIKRLYDHIHKDRKIRLAVRLGFLHYEPLGAPGAFFYELYGTSANLPNNDDHGLTTA